MGPFEGSASFKFNSMFGLYDQTTFRTILASQTEELRFFQLSHEEVLGSEGTKFQMSYNLSRSRPGFTFRTDLGTNVESDSQELAFRVTHPVIRTRSRNLTLNGSFVWRKSLTDLAFAELFDDRLRILRAGASYDFVDQFRGISLIEVEASQGLDIFNESKSGSAGGVGADISRVNGKSNFFKVTADASRLQRLFPGVSLLISATGQYSGSQLLSSEEFGYGGSSFGRAYDSSEITGEHGAAGKLELQYGRAADDIVLVKDFQLYLFSDYGATWRIDPVANNQQKHTQTGSSAGVGVRFNVIDNVSGFVEVDQPLTRQVATGGVDGGETARIFFALAARF